jgi:hypothetical protein
MKIHPVFHLSLLEPATTKHSPIPGHTKPPPPAIIVDGQQEWEVKEIIDSHYYRKQLQYKVKWKGFHDEDKTWYPSSNFNNSPEAIKDFYWKYPQKAAPQN